MIYIVFILGGKWLYLLSWLIKLFKCNYDLKDDMNDELLIYEPVHKN